MKRPPNLAKINALLAELDAHLAKHPEALRGIDDPGRWIEILERNVMPRPRKDDPGNNQLHLKVNSEVMRAIEKERERLSAAHAGLEVSLSDAVRSLIMAGARAKRESNG